MDNERRAWELNGRKPLYWEDSQIGTFVSRVTEGVLGSVPCKVIELRGTRTQVVLDRRKQEQNFRAKALRNWYVTAEGKILAEDFRMESDHGVWAFDLRWNADDSYTVTLEEPGRPKRTLGPVTPGQDVVELREAMFKPMLRLPSEMATKEKSFWWYDPWRGGFKQAKASFYDKFDGIYWDKKWKGVRVDISGVTPNKFRAYVSEGGWYLRADLDGYFFLHRDDEPKDDGEGRHFR